MTKKGYKQPPEIRLKHSIPLRKGAFFNCLICGKEFWRKPRDIKNGNIKFCCREHYFEWQKGKTKNVLNPAEKSGENNPNWQGGITPTNTLIRNSQETIDWRNTIFERDNWTCQKCGARSMANQYIRIEAHHIKPFAKFPELRFEIDNGITLCKKCHDKEPKGKDIWNVS
jgi:hypothetical protein